MNQLMRATTIIKIQVIVDLSSLYYNNSKPQIKLIYLPKQEVAKIQPNIKGIASLHQNLDMSKVVHHQDSNQD